MNYYYNININNANNKITDTSQKVKLLKYHYTRFVEKIDKSDFCNTAERYLTELSYVKKLKELYAEYERPDLSQEMAAREKTILEKLKDDFGITFKE